MKVSVTQNSFQDFDVIIPTVIIRGCEHVVIIIVTRYVTIATV